MLYVSNFEILFKWGKKSHDQDRCIDRECNFIEIGTASGPHDGCGGCLRSWRCKSRRFGVCLGNMYKL